MKTKIEFKVEYEGEETDPQIILNTWSNLIMAYLLESESVPGKHPVLGEVTIIPEQGPAWYKFWRR